MVYDKIKGWLDDRFKDSPLTFRTATAGGIAGAASVLANNPIDVVKTVMQGFEAHKYKNTAECAKAIWHEDGIRGFYKGTTPRLCRIVASVAITFTLVEHVRNALDRFVPA
jgi:solute carrier family 25 citrate transporter 1